MKVKVIGMTAALFLVGLMAGTARADFVRQGTQHLDVTTSHDTGILYDTSTANVLAGGSISYAYTNDEASLHVWSGGTVGSLRAYDTSTVDISGGGLTNIFAYATSTVDISGGAVPYLYAYATSTVEMSGGGVGYLFAEDTATVDISGGQVSSLNAEDTNTVDISGGQVTSLYAKDTSTVDVSGGTVSSLYAYDTNIVDISGGTVSSLYAYRTSTVTLHGYDFRTTAGLTLDGDRVLGTGTLTGKWYGQDDTMWIMTISGHSASATIRIVPEPATLTLLTLGGLAILRRRRKR